MKIKNILALGLIAVVSGISTAQTYTATAGTNGTTDIQSDYSVATGDGASVSVDVPLEFELPKKVAIAVQTASNDITTNPMFSHYVGYVGSSNPDKWKYKHSTIYDGMLHSNQTSYPNGTNSYIAVSGGIYFNSDNVSITFNSPTEFIHETDTTSVILPQCYTNKGASCARLYTKDGVLNSTNNATNYTKNISIDSAYENQINFLTFSYFAADSIDPTDRAGKYLSTATVTVSTL